MRTILYGILLLFWIPVSAEIKTKEQADQFIEAYCISLVNEIEKAVRKQEALAEKKGWEEFIKTGAWISGVADTYSKLCK